jgi:hypothetical protein
MPDACLQNVLYFKFIEPVFKLPSIAIVHTFRFPGLRSKPHDEPAEQNSLDFLANLKSFISELDPDLVRKAARLKASDSSFSSVHQIAEIQSSKFSYKSLYLKWMWRQDLLASLLKSVKESATPGQSAREIHIPWWCIIELKLKSEEDEGSVRDEMANRLADIISGRPSAASVSSKSARKKQCAGYEIKIIGCFVNTAKLIVQELIDAVSILQKKKTSSQGYRRPDISVFDLVKEDDFAESTIPTQALSCWRKRTEAPIRPLHSVQIPRSAMNALCHDLKTFLASKDRLESMGLKWRRGYLLHGPPGNGKSSFIRAVANELGCDIFNLCVSDPAINDGNWRTLLEPLSRCNS